jgi:hypothetical protein
MKGFYKYLIIIGVVVLIIGYLWKYPCDSFPNVSVLKYIYNLKCVAPTKTNISGGTLPNTNNNLGQNTKNQGNNNSLSQTGNVGIIYDNEIKNYFVNEKNEVFVVDYFGKIIKVVNGQSEIINDSNSGNPYQVLFSPSGEKILIDFSDFISIFDLQNKNWRQLNLNSFGASFDLNNNVYYFQKENASNSIFKLDLSKDDSKPQKLIQLNILDSYLISKNKEEVFIISKPSSLAHGGVLLFNNQNKNISLIYEFPGLNFNWDQKTQNGVLLTSGGLNKGGKFFWINKNLKNQELSFLTLPSKCIFNEELTKVNEDVLNQTPTSSTSTLKTTQVSTTTKTFLICAVPRNQNELKNKYITDDYLSYELYTEDDIYKIDLNSGETKIVFNDKTKSFDMDKLQLVNNRIFFINRFDKKLYSINLNQNN